MFPWKRNKSVAYCGCDKHIGINFHTAAESDFAQWFFNDYSCIMGLWPTGIRRGARDPMVVSSKPRSDISVEVTSQC